MDWLIYLRRQSLSDSCPFGLAGRQLCEEVDQEGGVLVADRDDCLHDALYSQN